ncbi:MAG: flippase [Patescibacteria group bacterium]
MKEESVSRNTAFLTASYIWQKLLSFVYFVLVARFIGVEDLGKYTFAISFATLFAVFIDFGFNSAIIRESAKNSDNNQKFFSTILTFKVLISVLTYLVVVVAVNLLNYPVLTKSLVYLAGIPMVFDQLSNTFWSFFRGARNLKYESWNIVFNQIIVLVVGTIVLFSKLPLAFLMAPFLAASFFSVCFSLFCIMKKLDLKMKFIFDKKIFIDLFKIALPFALIALFSRVYGYIDSIFLSKMSGDSAVAYYNVAMKIPFALQFIPASLSAAVFPAFSFHFANNREQLKYTFEKVSKFTALIAMPVSFGVAFVAPTIIKMFYGAKYEASILPLQILMLGLYFVFINFILGALLNATDRQFTNTKIVFGVMILNVVLNLILIPKLSFIGSSIVFLCSHSLLMLISLIVAKRICDFSVLKFVSPIFKSLIASAAMVGVLLFFKNQNLFLQILIGAVVYIVLIFLIRAVKREEFVDFKNSIFKKKFKEVSTTAHE